MKNQPVTEPIKRGEFVRSLGLSSAALMAFYCMGTLTACSSKNDPAPVAPNPKPPVTGSGLTGNTETGKGAINFTIDLTNSDYKALKTVGEFVKIGDVLVANTKSGNLIAVQRLCTHQGLDGLGYQLGTDEIKCSVHGSAFGTDGKVKNGPAINALKVYKTALSIDGNKLTVVA